MERAELEKILDSKGGVKEIETNTIEINETD